MEDLIYETLEHSSKHAVFSIGGGGRKAKLSVSNFESFPREWKLEIETDQKNRRFWHELIAHATTYVESRGGNRLVVILDQRQDFHEEESILRNNEFVTYFIEKHFVLDLMGFSVTAPSIQGIQIQRWSGFHHIDHEDDQYLQKLHDLYQVEYQADFEVRTSGRWDQFDPDPQEFVKRFTSGEARDDLMFVARAVDDIVGLIYPWLENDEEAGIFFTGTIPQYTNRGIATALKIYLAHQLRERGYRRLVTKNRASNLAILRTNEKLGFKPTYERVFLKLDI